MMKPDRAKQLLIADLENKKSYPARFDQTCPTCGEQIEEGDDIFFVGNTRVCDADRIELIEYLEDL